MVNWKSSENVIGMTPIHLEAIMIREFRFFVIIFSYELIKNNNFFKELILTYFSYYEQKNVFLIIAKIKNLMCKFSKCKCKLAVQVLPVSEICTAVGSLNK
ncbi:hypothetical protein CHUAL_006869 [Chamberlinius hualienensis]